MKSLPQIPPRQTATEIDDGTMTFVVRNKLMIMLVAMYYASEKLRK